MFGLFPDLESFHNVTKDNLKDTNSNNQNVYRLVYIEYFNSGSGDILRHTSFDYFLFPEGISEKDGYAILSYLTDEIERVLDIDKGGYTSVKNLNDIFDLERFGFKKIKYHGDYNKIKNIYTIQTFGILRSIFYKRPNDLIEWYKKGVTKEEVENIYNKMGIEFKDVVWHNEEKLTKKLNKNDD